MDSLLSIVVDPSFDLQPFEFNLFVPADPSGRQRHSEIQRLYNEIFALRVEMRNKQRRIKQLKSQENLYP